MVRRALCCLAWACAALLASSCAPTLTPFNEPLPPPAATVASDAIEPPDDHDVTPYAKQVLTEKIVLHAKGLCRKRDGRSVAEDYAPDALIRAPGGSEVRGLAAIAARWDAEAAVLSDTTCPGPQVFIKGGTAVVLSAAAGRHTGLELGVEATGRTVGVMTASAVVFTPDGKIIEEREYSDAATLFAQLGLYDRPRRVPMVPGWALECHIATGAPEERTNAAIAKQMQRAFERCDVTAYAAALDDDVVWDDYTDVAPTRGKHEVVKRFGAQAGAISRAMLDCETRGIVDYVVSECILSGVQSGALAVAGMSVAPTHADMVVHTLEILQIRGGKVLRGWTYGNSVELAKQLGVWRPVAPHDARGDAGGPAARRD
jgi:ketosteroid isomerase-like protein